MGGPVGKPIATRQSSDCVSVPKKIVWFERAFYFMLRLGLLIGGLAAGAMMWPEIQDEFQADERIVWAGVLPAVYIIGMWALLDGRS